MHIIIDTREQRPWSFPPELATVSREKLDAGDYALASDPHFVIERKSLDDLAGTLSTGWDRFLRELDRMDAAEVRPQVVIVESDWLRLLHHDYNHPKVKPAFLRSRICYLTFRGVHVLFADNPTAAAGMAWGLFRQRQKMIVGEMFDVRDSNSASEKGETGQGLALPE